MIHSQLERLKTEGLVDVFQAVKAARIQRPGVIPNIVCPAVYSAGIDLECLKSTLRNWRGKGVL